MKRRKQEVPIFENPIAKNNIAEFVVNVKATTQDMKCFFDVVRCPCSECF